MFYYRAVPGKRLWPLSNDVRSKQFIEIFKTPDHGYESMVQRVYRQIKQINPDANVTIATSKAQVQSYTISLILKLESRLSRSGRYIPRNCVGNGISP